MATLVAIVAAAWTPLARAITYANTATTFNWIDASSHTKVGYNTTPYKFNGGGGCGTNPPILDDTLSDNIPIGFNFMYGGVNFTHVRIMSNGRLQFNNNTTCGYGSPVTQLPYPNASLNYTMRIYGNDLDPTAKSEVPAYNTVCLNRASCYISYATLGTAPYRSFVVTWNNVPEWAAGGSTSGNYNLQIILQENGEFIYQYGNNTPGPGNTTAQVGWQVDTNDYDVPFVGLPANNTAIKFYIPRPVAEYRMEQPSWNGTAGEVLDTSGNGRHGTAIQAGAGTRPQDVATGKVCRGGQIRDNNSKTDISAIDTGIAIPTTVGSSGTISFWYNNSKKDRMLFDASVTNNRWFYLQRTNNRALSFVVTDSGNTNRTVTTANNVLPNNGWSHIVVSWSFNNLAGSNQDRLRVWVDGVLRKTTSFTTANVVSPQIGTLYIGDNRSAVSPLGRSAGNPGGSNASIDEFRIYNFEGGLALVQRDMNQTGACLSHLAISHAGTALACNENDVTVTAHDATHNVVVMPNNTTQITLSTSTGQGDWTLKDGYGVLNNGAPGDGIATYLFNGEYQAVFGLTHPASGTVNINVSDGQITEQEDPDLVLSPCVTVSRFNACHDYATSQCKAAGRLYTRLANTSFDTDVVALDSSGNPDTGFTGKAVVSLIARRTPGSVDGQNCFTPDYTQVLDNAVTNFISGRLPLTGITVPNAYRDARIKVECDATHCPPSGITACSTDNFAIRPLALVVLSTDANADATGTSATASPKIKAGDPFSLTATAVAGYDGTPQIDNARVAAHDGATPGNLTGSFGAADPVTGSATGVSFSYTEVGYFRLNAYGVYDAAFTAVDQPSDCTGDFSNELVDGKVGCKFGNTSATDYFGRFYPHHFDTEVNNACGSFTYSGQPFPLKVTARNLAGGITAKYTDAFAKTVTLADANGAAGTFNPAALPAGDFDSGVANAALTPNVSFSFSNKQTAPAVIQVRASDGEATSADGTTEGTTTLRSGRLRLINAHGSEQLGLTMPIQTQYWNGTAWVTNTLDSCTTIEGSLVFVKTPASMPSPSGGDINAGKGSLNFIAPNQQGSVEVCANIGSDTDNSMAGCRNGASHPWLQGSWDADGNYDDNPSARATFGIYQGRDPVIYRRERY